MITVSDSDKHTNLLLYSITTVKSFKIQAQWAYPLNPLTGGRFFSSVVLLLFANIKKGVAMDKHSSLFVWRRSRKKFLEDCHL